MIEKFLGDKVVISEDVEVVVGVEFRNSLEMKIIFGGVVDFMLVGVRFN